MSGGKSFLKTMDKETDNIIEWSFFMQVTFNFFTSGPLTQKIKNSQGF